MMPAPAPAQAVSPRKRSSRNAWFVALGLLVALGVTVAVLWQRILAGIRAARPEMLVLVAVAAWAATVLAMYSWRLGSVLRLRRRARRTEDALFERLQRQVDAAWDEAIELAAVTTEWAVRAELVRDDFEDVQEYMQRLVKRPRLRRAFVAKRDGTVIGAGDRTQRGKAIQALVPAFPSESSSVQKVPVGGSGMLLVVPVMGLESRLGTLVIEVERPSLAR
jgi:hypothetical protein